MPSKTQLEIRVTYDAPAYDCRRVLRILPLLRPTQKIIRENWRVTPEPRLQIEKTDEFGNRRLFIHHPKIERAFELGLELEVETCTLPLEKAAHENVGAWRMPSRAVDFSEEIVTLARSYRELSSLERAQTLCNFCFENLAYTDQTSGAPQRASEILKLRIGTCADFAHVFLGLCRASGLAARYVAGFNPTEGQMHAWAEVLLDNHWVAFDPTHGRSPSHGSIAVAIGRDFYDCMPHTGSFRGTAQAQILLYCRTTIEG